ncbi:MAG: 4-hydroxy-tetrahydrodipicolinate reductase [Candidatus Binatia bacterium]
MAASVAITVCGAAGRMGRRIIALAARSKTITVAGAVEARDSEFLGEDAGELAGSDRLGVALRSGLDEGWAEGSVIVDFTHAAASLEHLEFASEHATPIVVGSTGMSEEQRESARRLASTVPTVMAANMSVGINVLIDLLEEAVRKLGPDFDCEIVELHHRRKKDAPSGTALALAETAAAASGSRRRLVLSREGLVGERDDEEIGVVALRGGDAPGDHTVMLVGQGERLELTHRAYSRDCLASGALKAAVWIADRKAGLYSMRDVIGLR